MKTTRPLVVDELYLALQAASSDTSTYTTQTIQASYAIVPDFFNGLLGPPAVAGVHRNRGAVHLGMLNADSSFLLLQEPTCSKVDCGGFVGLRPFPG